MPDDITGLAVLQPTWVEGIWRLHYQSAKGNGTKFSSWIFIRDEKDNHLPDRMPDYYDGMNHIWKFRREGSRLHCHPSVNDIGNGFHNYLLKPIMPDTFIPDLVWLLKDDLPQLSSRVI